MRNEPIIELKNGQYTPCHSASDTESEGLWQDLSEYWIPVSTGMTGERGMTGKELGMTEKMQK